jgi:RNA polymerase sigma-70 factor, ECF subfamily
MLCMPDPVPGLYEDLIARIAEGDREAFGELYRLCRPDVYRFAAHMSGSPVVAEDVVQDVFMAVIRDVDRYRPGRSGVLPWLLGIAHNHVRRWKHRRVFSPLPMDESPAGRRLAAETDPVGELARREHEAELTRALLALPARYREVIVLCDLQEFSYESAAGALGCAVGTVRSRLHRGRARLARALGDSKSDVRSYGPYRSSTNRSQA